MRERQLLAGRLERLPAAVERVHRHRAEARGRRDRAAVVHELDERGRRPRMGWTSAPAAAGAPFPSTAARTSSFVTRPRGPDPEMSLTSRPCALAMRAATGVTLPPLLAGASAAGLGSVTSALGWTEPFDPPDPAAIRQSTDPTGMV